MAYVISNTFRCHLNPIVSIRLTVGGRIESSELPNYIFSQVLGAILAAGVLYLVASVKAGFDLSGRLAPMDMVNIPQVYIPWALEHNVDRILGGC
jgi:aquaporin Z